ncbi:MAG TPA: hypothetical protein VGM29_09000 [Polyangiaceae bacterium]|jgi:hypothetical protein
MLGSCILDDRSLRDEPSLAANNEASDADAVMSPTCTDDAADCSGNLLVNADFDHDTRGWQAEQNVIESWSSLDAAQAAGSGSLELVNTNQGDVPGVVVAGAEQCVPVAEQVNYRLSARVHVTVEGGAGGFDVSFFSSSDCSDAALGEPSSDFASTSSGWQLVQTDVASPASARSARIRLLAVKAFSAAAAPVQYDEVGLSRR